MAFILSSDTCDQQILCFTVLFEEFLLAKLMMHRWTGKQLMHEILRIIEQFHINMEKAI